MNTRADTLRSTLDHLALDPRAKDDRKYLVSMLRRLGYTEQQIREAVGVADEEPRIIEIEYRRGRKTPTAFNVVEADEDSVGFSVTEGHVPAPGGDPAVGHGWIPVDGDVSARGPDTDNPWETDESEWVTEAEAEELEVDYPEPTVEFSERTVEDAQAWPDEAPQAAPVEDDAWETSGDEEAWGYASKDASAVMSPDVEEADPTVEAQDFVPAPAQEAWPEAPEDEALVEAAAEPAVDMIERAAPTEEWTEVQGEYQVEGAPAGAWTAQKEWVPAAQDIEAAEDAVDEIEAFAYGDYYLYTRMVDLSTGRQQRIYFFAKNEPRSGVPCLMPEGYIVEENVRTGLPFLRRDPNAVEPAEPAEPPQGAHDHCQATTKAGDACKKAPMEGSDFCNIHKGRA